MINLTNVILHILDSNHQAPILSVKELELEPEVRDFFEKHISRIINEADIKKAFFDSDKNDLSSLCNTLLENKEFFIATSQEIANRLFDLMKKNPSIPIGDLAVALFEDELQGKYLAILKLNYKSSYIHFVLNSGEGSVNKLVKQKTTLPNESQKIDEGIIINLSNSEIKVLEKKYDIAGEREFYLSKYFLKCTSDLSSLQKVKILEKAGNKISKKHFDKEFDTVTKIKTFLAESIEEFNEIQVKKVADKVFGEKEEIKREYIEQVQKAGLVEEIVAIPPANNTSKKFKTQKVKTDNGIEINFPSHFYNDKDLIEFINNPDGTISILIKNVTKVTNR